MYIRGRLKLHSRIVFCYESSHRGFLGSVQLLKVYQHIFYALCLHEKSNILLTTQVFPIQTVIEELTLVSVLIKLFIFRHRQNDKLVSINIKTVN